MVSNHWQCDSKTHDHAVISLYGVMFSVKHFEPLSPSVAWITPSWDNSEHRHIELPLAQYHKAHVYIDPYTPMTYVGVYAT